MHPGASISSLAVVSRLAVDTLASMPERRSRQLPSAPYAAAGSGVRDGSRLSLSAADLAQQDAQVVREVGGCDRAAADRFDRRRSLERLKFPRR